MRATVTATPGSGTDPTDEGDGAAADVHAGHDAGVAPAPRRRAHAGRRRPRVALRPVPCRAWTPHAGSPKRSPPISAGGTEYPPFEPHPALDMPEERMEAAFAELAERLRDNYPFFHPRYAGQMLKPPHPAAVVGLPGGDARQPQQPRARRRPGDGADGARGRGAAGRDVRLRRASTSATSRRAARSPTSRRCSSRASCTRSAASPTAPRPLHARADVRPARRRPGHPVPVDAARADGPRRAGRAAGRRSGRHRGGDGRHDGARRHRARARDPGRRRPPRRARPRRRGVRRLLRAAGGRRTGSRREPWRGDRARATASWSTRTSTGSSPTVAAQCCFADPSVGRFYLHDSPYTYFTSDELHLGEISLECSRAGASAAALWLTFQVLPPTRRRSARCSRRAGAPRCTGPSCWPAPRRSRSTSRRSWTS